MAAVDPALRDAVLTEFRQAVCRRLGIVPFLHQAKWWAATDGLIVHDAPPVADDSPSVQVLIGEDSALPQERWLERRLINGQPFVVVRRATSARPHGRARVVADLGSFKIGKSLSSAIWASGFAAIPGARIKLIGFEYDTCAPEFEYLVEALCSARGMNIRPDSLQNRPRDGRMWLDLQNGARFEARSWDRKEGLKGKEDDAYIICEAYQLPGLECYTDYKQNLEKRKGYFVVPTTPDRPWVKVFHEHGHQDPQYPDWECVCGVKRSVNPYTFDASAKAKDRGLMTKEKFAIHYEGQLGEFVGSVFGYVRGQRQCTPTTHPDCWIDPHGAARPENFRIPAHWTVLGAADTGTFTSGLLAAVSPNGDLIFFYEQPNYSYVSGVHEFDPQVTISTWKAQMRRAMDRWGVRFLLADENSQFKRELAAFPDPIALRGAKVGLEQRTEVLREYFQAQKVFLAPWLSVLPYELERAQWPEETTGAGRFGRKKKQDHTLDGAEHIAATRPLTKHVEKRPAQRFIESLLGPAKKVGHPHLGVA